MVDDLIPDKYSLTGSGLKEDLVVAILFMGMNPGVVVEGLQHAKNFLTVIQSSATIPSPGTHPATPIGRRGSPINAEGANSSAWINGRYYSGHALDQMQGRGIMPSVVEDTISHGIKSLGNTPGTAAHTTNQLKVILNQSGDVVTTITQ
jgi:hypothetical protein